MTMSNVTTTALDTNFMIVFIFVFVCVYLYIEIYKKFLGYRLFYLCVILVLIDRERESGGEGENKIGHYSY